MFTPDNFCNDGIKYDYDALNELLKQQLDEINPDSPSYGDYEKHFSDQLNNAMYESNGEIYIDNTVVGTVVND